MMRRITLVLMVLTVVIATPHVCSAGAFDGVGSTLAPGKVSFSQGYWYQEDNWKVADMTLTAKVLGFTYTGTYSPGSFRTQSNQAYIQGAIGLFPGWELYARLNGGDLKTTNLDPNWSSSMKFFGTVGVNGTFYKDKTFSLGPFAQYTWYDTYTTSFSQSLAGLGTLNASMTIQNYYTVKTGLAAAVNVKNAFTVYGGPFWNYSHANLNLNGTASLLGISGSVSNSSLMSNKDDFGGFLGVRVPLAKAVSMGVEGQYTGVWAAGVKLIVSF
jgi:hypothetical protein